MPATTTVVNCKRKPYDVYIGRPSIWGCPWAVGWAADRPTVLRKYREYVLSRPDLMELLPSLRGKRLGCFCKPKACHGDVLVDLIKELPNA